MNDIYENTSCDIVFFNAHKFQFRGKKCDHGVELLSSANDFSGEVIYDGDDTTAGPGANIGKARLAWSYRPSVQALPYYYGRAIMR